MAPILRLKAARAAEAGGALIMGDKSPKSNKKQAAQKQSKADADTKKKTDTAAAKAASSTAKK